MNRLGHLHAMLGFMDHTLTVCLVHIRASDVLLGYIAIMTIYSASLALSDLCPMLTSQPVWQ